MGVSISLKDKAALVTGGGRGMGRAIALRFAEAGCKGVAVLELMQDEALEEVGEEIKKRGSEPLLIAGDVSDCEAVRKAVDSVVQKWGRIDVLMNNAGIGRRGDFFNTPEDEWKKVLDVNLSSVFYGMKYAAGYMKEQGGGAIINMASMSGVTGGTQGPHYSASKAGVIALTKFGAMTLGKFGIRVNAMAPGYIQTDMLEALFKDPEVRKQRWATIPAGRPGDPQEVANMAAFLASDLASYVSGDTMLVTGGRLS
ncbi:MAG: SDR family NAD(P)-dependent oxidoreductase [Christensenellales bacterium]